MRQGVPLAICFIAGIVMIVAYFIPHAPFGATRGVFEQRFLVIQAFAMVLGVLNLMKINGQKVMRKKAGWGYGVVLLVALSVTIVSGLGWGMGEGSVFGWIFENINIPLGATMFSLLAFFVASASYRAFRARTTEAALLLIAATLVMLGRVPLGAYIWQRFPEVADWIMAIPNMAGQRAIMIGIALGIISMSLRVIIGIERGYLGTRE